MLENLFPGRGQGKHAPICSELQPHLLATAGSVTSLFDRIITADRI